MAFSIYDILTEAPKADNNQDQDNNTDSDDYSIDTDVDTDGGGDDNDDEMTDLGGDDEDTGDEDSIDDTGSDNNSDDEPVEANTDMFSSLSSEEQQMKIKELKQQYATLYSSCDSLLEKLSSIDSNEVTIGPISRMNNILNTLKTYITDYLYNRFSSTSNYENDVMYVRFLSIFNTVKHVLEDIVKTTISSKET